MTKWLGEKRKAPKKHYVADFVDRYMDPTEVTNRISGLARSSRRSRRSSICRTRRTATAGRRRRSSARSRRARFYVSSKAYGHEGGNDISLRAGEARHGLQPR
ncbi:hypothetical protein [Streptosporangium vulgare]|uniref:hypothetical protein n=1 Tax=Streptosporangium vulgare TaxID=46190 RepID=UPI0031DFC826